MKLKELRNEKGITQKTVADALGISTTCYAKYEQGNREPDLKMLVNLANYFKVTTDYLLGRKDI